MPPKKPTQQSDEEPSLSDVHKLLTSLSNEVKTIKTLVESLSEENKELRRELKEKDKQLEDMQTTITDMQVRQNNLEQHHRGWGARVLNLPVTEEEEADPEVMIEKVYQLALRPILEGAHQAGMIKSIPDADQVLEIAHVLPGKPDQPKPIIMRFYNRNLRNLIFRFKRDFAPRERNMSGSGGGRSGGAARSGNDRSGTERPGRFKYPLYDDLTKVNLA